MSSKLYVVFCAHILFVQSALSQCVGPAAIDANLGYSYGWGGRSLAYDGLIGDGAWPARGLGVGCGGPGIGITATSGGGLPVTSGSAIPPVGVSVAADTKYEGVLTAGGELPFVGTVSVEGVLPTAGAGAVNYGCGNGATAMVSDIAPGIAGSYGAYGAAGIAGPVGGFGTSSIVPGVGAPGWNRGWNGRGVGCAL